MISFRQPAKPIRQASFLLLFLSIIIRQCIGGSQLRNVEFKHSPFSVGVRSALQDHPLSSWGRRRTQRESTLLTGLRDVKSSRDDDKKSRYASVYGSEVEALSLTMAPAIRFNPKKIPQNPTDFDLSNEQANVVYAAKQRKKRVGTGSDRQLFFWENMVSGAVSRSVAQTVMHPANTMKTIMQSSRGPERPTIGQLFRPSMFKTLSRGAGANFVLSIPHGAVNFAVLEFVRGRMSKFVDSVPTLAKRKEKIGPGLDFLSSAFSTVCCSVISTPQMMITDNIMAGNYPGLKSACVGLYKQRGIQGFYSGWLPGLAGKIPSYALTWTFFQQLKRVRNSLSERPAENYENTIMGCIASAATVCIMIPVDTIKTRLVTQSSSIVSNGVPYKGIIDCAVRITREEGIKTFYRGLAPRLMSVVPMIGIQFGVYEAVKKMMLQRDVDMKQREDAEIYVPIDILGDASMEVSASQEEPYPAPLIRKKR